MTIDLFNPAHMFLLSLAFFLWGFLHTHVTEKMEKCEETFLEFPTLAMNVVILLLGAASLLAVILKSL